MSNTLQGAGGVGGLLATLLHDLSLTTLYFHSYDGNGNTSELIDAGGILSAHYEYDTFGKGLLATGTFANVNLYRFSTKPRDVLTGLDYYGHRFYDSMLSRWINRDPIEEIGGNNLYSFVLNSSVNKWDYLGFAITVNPKCVDDCKKGEDCCRCMVFCEGEGGCVTVVYHVMKNRQYSQWGEFKNENSFCDQAKSGAFDCGPTGKLLKDGVPHSGQERYDKCCKKTLPKGRSPESAEKVCKTPGKDPTNGAQFFFTKGKTRQWMQYNLSIGNCSKVVVPNCNLEIYKCKGPTKPMPPNWRP